MTGTCAPTIVEEMADWTGMGGGNSGCYGNKAHRTGFHRAGSEIPTTDYSRRHEPGRPYDMSWACAGDYHHGGDPALRAKGAELLARLLRRDPALHMVCEFIGQPWAGKPILYWCAWDNPTSFVKYTGAGHDVWFHISLWRSKANLRPYLWRPNTAVTPVVIPTQPTPGQLAVDGILGPVTIRRWQTVLGLEWRDGKISKPSDLVAAVQRKLNASIGAGLKVDGDGIRQDGRRYATTAALQRYLGTMADGRLSVPRSMAVQALQRRLNAGTF